MIVLLGFFVVLLFMLPKIIENDNRIFRECLRDYKEYECRAMLRSRGGGSTIPIFIKR